MKIIGARIDGADLAGCTALELEAAQATLRKLVARDLPVYAENGGLECSVMKCSRAQHEALTGHLTHLRALEDRTPADDALLTAFGG